MLVAIAALLFQFPTLSAHPVQADQKIVDAAAVKAASADSNKPQSTTNSTTQVLTADAFPAGSEASVAFEPGRLVPEPVAPVASSPAGPANPAPFVATPPAASIAAHSAAGFDAWSTRRVLSSVPQAQEMNPFLRPFAGNASMYAAVQVAPTIFDYLSHRMMTSRHEFFRHTWWLPQAVSATVSVASGVHNVGVYHSR